MLSLMLRLYNIANTAKNKVMDVIQHRHRETS